MSGNRRKALLVSTAVACGALLMTACQDTDAATGSGAAQGSASTPAAAGASAPSGSQASGAAGASKGSDSAGKGTKGGTASGNGGKQAGQTCGANDISWSTKSESQAGGYILITAKAKAGITCVLPAALPTVAFGSDGTQAGPAEQSVGKQITLTGNTAAYAGVNPKTTKTNGGREFESIIVAVGNTDPNPESLPVGTITVDKPVVTNWHTSAKDAVPGV
ncbi:DUF4232 domain-containing protein [Streptomyces sp. SPB4]|uniref:DUF4232 domain-containing protein n=1 Tax=Streptomyces TaxID=1883 RepID=UPI0024734245|nr:DUF4232 domain-containing protein [Streptomyces sp. SPB4]MDH6543515.1 hypothetical protein [Streptomyces sp. SPB4]